MTKFQKQFVILCVIIFFAAMSRIVFHIPNFSPLAAIALFGAAHFQKKWMAIVIPFLATWLSDITLNNTIYAHYHSSFLWFYPGFYWQYGSYLLITIAAVYWFKRGISPLVVAGASIGSSLLFFVISNFGVWVSTAMYAKSVAGLVACYTAAIPFYRGTATGDLVFSAVLFGGYYLLQQQYEFLKSPKPQSQTI